MMTMTEEKQTPNAISFIIEMPAGTTTTEVPEIKKRLEAESAAFAPTTSLEQINAKLEKAENKRKLSLTHNQGSEEKIKKVLQRKSTLEQAALEENTKFEENLTLAEQKREELK